MTATRANVSPTVKNFEVVTPMTNQEREQLMREARRLIRATDDANEQGRILAELLWRLGVYDDERTDHGEPGPAP